VFTPTRFGIEKIPTPEWINRTSWIGEDQDVAMCPGTPLHKYVVRDDINDGPRHGSPVIEGEQTTSEYWKSVWDKLPASQKSGKQVAEEFRHFNACSWHPDYDKGIEYSGRNHPNPNEWYDGRYDSDR